MWKVIFSPLTTWHLWRLTQCNWSDYGNFSKMLFVTYQKGKSVDCWWNAANLPLPKFNYLHWYLVSFTLLVPCCLWVESRNPHSARFSPKRLLHALFPSKAPPLLPKWTWTSLVSVPIWSLQSHPMWSNNNFFTNFKSKNCCINIKFPVFGVARRVTLDIFPFMVTFLVISLILGKQTLQFIFLLLLGTFQLWVIRRIESQNNIASFDVNYSSVRQVVRAKLWHLLMNKTLVRHFPAWSGQPVE